MLKESVATESIYGFAHVAQQANVSPSEESVFVLTGPQLQEIVTKAIQPLRDEVAQLKATVARQDGKMADLEATQDLHAENQLIQLRLINDLRKDRGPEEPSQKVVAHLATIEEALYARSPQFLAGKKDVFMTYYDVEQLLDLSHRRVSQLADLARHYPNFVIGWHPSKKNVKVFKLNGDTLGDRAIELNKILYGGK